MTRLTSAEKRLIGDARELSVMEDSDVLARYPSRDPAGAYAGIFGTAQSVLRHLADLAERLDEDQADEDTRRLGKIRAVLAGFDWEHDDRQYALEAIERIVEDGQA